MLCRYRPLAAAVALVLITSALAGCGGASRPAASGVPGVLADCSGKPHAEPNFVIVRCNDLGLMVQNVKWSGWGSRVAVGSGTGIYNVCEYIDCHTGTWGSFPVVVIVSGKLTCPDGKRAYARVQSVFAGNFTDWPMIDQTQMFPRPCGHVPGAKIYSPKMSLG